MGRKRSSSFVESSDDEFQLSDAEASPLFSRLKRPKRAHARDSAGPSASPQQDAFQPDDHNSSVVIPDSLDQDDKSIAASVAESVPHTPKDPCDDDTRETERPSERAGDSGEENAREEDDDVVEVVDEAGHSKDAEQSPSKAPAANADDTSTAGRRRKSRKVYQIESDSEEESDKGNDDDDAYNSAEDSPPEDDDDSEFDFSPQKPAKKRVKAPAKRAPLRQKAQTPPARKLATRKPAARKLAIKPGLAASKPSPAVQSKSKSDATAQGAKPRLGARLPHRGLLQGTPSAADRKRPQSSGKLPSTPVIRSGLSRKDAIPRLHAYLPR